MNISKNIDAVITWVDGEDPSHIKKRTSSSKFTQAIGENASNTRFNQRGEINFCVRSILQHAPWIRYIYIVTDAQTPIIYDLLKDTLYADKVKIIDHSVIFQGYESHLPTFNSLAIESMLWRIPGLSENFIYFNDDCVLVRPVVPEDFFKQDQLVMRGSWKIHTHHSWSHKFNNLCSRTLKHNDHRLIQERSAALIGYDRKFFHLPHVAFPLNKSLFKRYFAEHPEVLFENISYAFRQPTAQTWSISLMMHLAIQQKIVLFDHKLQAIMVHGGNHDARKILSRLGRAAHKKNVAFLCMQSLDLAATSLQTQCVTWLDQQIMSVSALIQRG